MHTFNEILDQKQNDKVDRGIDENDKDEDKITPV